MTIKRCSSHLSNTRKITQVTQAPIKLKIHKPQPAAIPRAAETQIAAAEVKPLTLDSRRIVPPPIKPTPLTTPEIARKRLLGDILNFNGGERSSLRLFYRIHAKRNIAESDKHLGYEPLHCSFVGQGQAPPLLTRCPSHPPSK